MPAALFSFLCSSVYICVHLCSSEMHVSDLLHELLRLRRKLNEAMEYLPPTVVG